MIDDANMVVQGATLEADTCIIGGGAAGIAIALRLNRTAQRVLLLDSGADAPDPETQALYDGEVADPDLHSPLGTYRQRRFGGSTTFWGGRCVPFDNIDFETRSWIPHSGWPINRDGLLPYYKLANGVCEAGEFVYEASKAVPGGMRPMIRSFAPRDFNDDAIERFSCPTNFGRRYRHRLAASRNVQVLLRANCTRLLTSPGGELVQRAVVRTLRGKLFHVDAKQFVLATGGLEVPRLLLASRDVHAAGLGNAEDLVGRHYMCHLAGTLGELRFRVPRDDVWHGYDLAEDGTYCRRRLAITSRAQREHQIGNIIFRLHHPRIPDPQHRTGPLSAIYLARRLISYEYGKRLHSEVPLKLRDSAMHAVNVASDSLATGRFLLDSVQKSNMAERKFPSIIIRPRTNLFSLDFHAEQAPNHASRVTLCEATDFLGLPRLRVDWRYSDVDVYTVETAFRLLQGEIAQWGGGSLSLGKVSVAAAIRRDGAYGGHHIGTTRMGSGPRTGVVDSNCQVFGVKNLFVAGSAIFATSSQANPTLTIVALAIRLADHLEHQAGRQARLSHQASGGPRALASVRGPAQPAGMVGAVSGRAGSVTQCEATKERHGP